MAPSKPRECVTWHKTDAFFPQNLAPNMLPDKIIEFFYHYFWAKGKNWSSWGSGVRAGFILTEETWSV
jgi:hypothetical protein